MENSYLPPPFSIIHIIVGHIVDKKQAKRDQSNRHAHDQDNKWFDTVIRSAIIDCLEVCYRPFRGFITMTVERIFCDSREVINYNLKSISDNFTSIFLLSFFIRTTLKSSDKRRDQKYRRFYKTTRGISRKGFNNSKSTWRTWTSTCRVAS